MFLSNLCWTSFFISALLLCSVYRLLALLLSTIQNPNQPNQTTNRLCPPPPLPIQLPTIIQHETTRNERLHQLQENAGLWSIEERDLPCSAWGKYAPAAARLRGAHPAGGRDEGLPAEPLGSRKGTYIALIISVVGLHGRHNVLDVNQNATECILFKYIKYCTKL